MRETVRPCARLEGDLSLPGDKSISHRAALFNAIAHGQATITHFSTGADCLSTVACLRALGASIESTSAEDGSLRLVVHGRGADALREAESILDAGNSGTSTRLLSGLLASRPFLSIITGDSSLRSRPMGRVIQPLRQMGAQIWGRRGDTQAPLAIRGGSLKGIRYRMPVASAQVKSAILIAGLFAEGETEVEEPVSTRDHTERMFRAMGADVRTDGSRVTIRPGKLHAVDVDVPGDISAAAFWLVAAAIHPDARIRVRNVVVNPSRTGVLDVLRAMGARIRQENQREVGGEPVADIVAESSQLQATEITGDLVPRAIDEIPILAIAAAVARGTTTIRNAEELRVKESDRIRSMAQELDRMGVQVEELPDGMVIHGGARLRGAACQSHGDHRLAMSLAVAGLVAQDETTIDDAEAASISYTSFWQDLRRLASLP
ncbi:MAG: 3-phosphoshikimate 1-carboxyvinyltransferase [Dehalococcoidia bacterium]|nr:3-phosphoshikimate 1-carboxyvinyltransferase [Dehalococcoidia bacterium]